MKGFFYFVPRAKSKARGVVEAAGITCLPESFKTTETNEGPDKGPGIIFMGNDIDSDLRKSCQWKQFAGFWLGVPDGICPEDLLREEIIGGHYVTLEDSNAWLVPVARIWRSGTAFPQRLALGPDGKWVVEPLERYNRTCADADLCFQAFMYEQGQREGADKEGFAAYEKPTWSIDDQIDIAVRALAVNYRVGPEEVSALGLFTSRNFTEILEALYDLPSIVGAEKKNVESETITSGAADGS